NAGMNQFKGVFLGEDMRPYKRAVTVQKCMRAGGKHNDLENVGYTGRHHTFFEMLGNFSFGDYFKDDAIRFAWELVTKNFGLSPDRLLVTVHSSDEEAAGIWKKVTGFSDDKVIRIPTSDNFWSAGDTGPCGPCTEIFYDHGDHIPGGPPGSPNADGDRFIEIWNNVFMQFEQIDAEKRINLPKPSVDTGMGLERIGAILQGVHSNYEIDIFQSIIGHIESLVSQKESPSHRVIADHLRASAFLMADGVMPSNEGRGYVLRRIMRRGMRHAHLLGAKEPLMYRLLPMLTSAMGDAYPELRRAESMVSEMLKLEEARFKKTLDNGLRLLDEETAKLSKGGKLSGDVAFKLYDTFGFPVDLTQDALKAKGIAVDMAGFEKSMERQRAEARKSWTGSGEDATDKVWFKIRDQAGSTEFLGYKTEQAQGIVKALVKSGQNVKEAGANDEVHIITNQTPFYGESGGQVGDAGRMTTMAGGVIEVKDTKKMAGGLFVHICHIQKGKLAVGDTVEMHVDTHRRNAIRANHSATHLLHAALREKLGRHVSQKGSVVDPNRLRFDIAHPKAVTAEEIREIEAVVNNEIRANTEALTRLMPVQEAIESGAMALFGEKYDDEVRVLTMGTEREGKPFSIELCGGTHVRRTGDIGIFYVVGESALSSGVRRIEALTGEGALRHFWMQDQRVCDVAGVLKSAEVDIVDRVKVLADEKKKLENEVSQLRRQLAT
ncbi:MAG TPA: alanine--tRNA ligase, partial [Alphaproteobacteria bacterium]